MKWLLLSFIVLTAFVGNAALLEHYTLLRALGMLALNLLVLSFGLTWWYGYFSKGDKRARGLILSHATLMLALAFGTILLGADLALSNSCDAVLSSSNRKSIRAQIADFAQSLGYCKELGLVMASIGVFLALPSIRLFVGLSRRA